MRYAYSRELKEDNEGLEITGASLKLQLLLKSTRKAKMSKESVMSWRNKRR